MQTDDWIQVGTLGVAVLALVASVVVARHTLRQQAAEATEALRHAAREALVNRLWERRADLYLDLLQWLEGRDASADDTRNAAWHLADDEDTRLLFKDLEDAIHDRAVSDVRRPEPVLEAISALLRHLELPQVLRLRMALYASSPVQTELERYRTTLVLPLLTEDGSLPLPELPSANDRVGTLRQMVIEEIGARTLEQPVT